MQVEPGGRLAAIRATRTDFAVATVLVVLFTAVGMLTIGQYGLSWDEPENLVVGERYLAFFRTGDVTLLDFSRARPEVDNPDGLHLRLLDSHAHPPLPNIVAAVAGRLLGRWTGWMDPINATDYWGTSYRRGFAWFSENTSPDATLYLPPAYQHLTTALKDLWLPEDVVLISGEKTAAGPVYVMHTTRQTEYTAVDWYCREQLRPVYVINVDGAPILEVFQLSQEEWERARGGEAWGDIGLLPDMQVLHYSCSRGGRWSDGGCSG